MEVREVLKEREEFTFALGKVQLDVSAGTIAESIEEATLHTEVIFRNPSNPSNSVITPSGSPSRSQSRSKSRSTSRPRYKSKNRVTSNKMEVFLSRYVQSNVQERGRKRNASSNVNSSQSKKSNADVR